MAVFEWNEEYRTGNVILDDQHRELFRAVKRLHDSFKAGRGPQEISVVLDFLAEYVPKHFGEEEFYMECMGFPDIGAHRLEHRLLACRVEELRSRHFIDDPSLGIGASQLLYQWLRDHILVLDMAYVEYARTTKHY